MTARLIDLKYAELHPTIRDLSDAGVTDRDATWIRIPGNAARVAQSIHEMRGIHEALVVVDDACPLVPDGWRVVEHQQHKRFDRSKAVLFCTKGQRWSTTITGHELREELKVAPVLNACVLDYLFDHQELVTEDWKGKEVFFWGTIYSDHDGHLIVRCLYWGGERWRTTYRWLDDRWNALSPAAVATM